MITGKEAVQIAFEFAADMYDEELIDLTLEEIELAQDEDFWLITLGFTRTYTKPVQVQSTSGLAEALSISPKIRERMINREYKLIKVDVNSGKAVSMKIRAV